MQYPGHSIQELPQVSLPEAVFNEFAASERSLDIEYVERPAAELVSMHLGRACLKVGESKKAARHHVAKARTLLRQRAPTPATTQECRLRLQDIYGDLIHFHTNPTAFREARIQHHATTISMLDESLRFIQHCNSYRGRANWTGLANELTTLAVLNRYCHPWMMALPALQHHDNGSSLVGNYDVAVLTASPYAPDATFRKVQVKSSSNGHDLESYVGCFMLNAGERFGYRNAGRNSRFPVAELLLKESYGQAGDKEIKQLDIITDNLLLDLSIN